MHSQRTIRTFVGSTAAEKRRNGTAQHLPPPKSTRRSCSAGSAGQHPASMLLRLLLIAVVSGRALQLGDLPLQRRCKGTMPPVGAVYTRTLTLPVLGNQMLNLSIINRTTAMLVMQGALNLNEPVLYRADGAGKLAFTLSDSTVRLLRRVRTSLQEAEYDRTTDSAYVTVSPPIIPAIRIRLDRTTQAGDDFSDAETHMALQAALN